MKAESQLFVAGILVTAIAGVAGVILAITVAQHFAFLAILGFLGTAITGRSFLSWSDKQRQNEPENIRKRLERDIALRRVELKHMEEQLQTNTSLSLVEEA